MNTDMPLPSALVGLGMVGAGAVIALATLAANKNGCEGAVASDSLNDAEQATTSSRTNPPCDGWRRAA